MMRPNLEMTGSKEEKAKYDVQPNAVNEAPLLLGNKHNNNNNITNADPHAHEVSGGTTTAAVFGIIKAMVGPAILYLPHSFADAGYAFAIIALWVCTALYLFTSNRLLSTWKYVVQSQPGRKPDAVSPSSSGDGEHHQKQQQGDSHNSYMEFEMTNLSKDGGVGEISPASQNTIKRRTTKQPFVDSSSASISDGSSGEKEVTIFDMESGAVAKTSFSYPKLARMAYGDLGESVVRTGITLMQLGVCLTYCK